MGGGWRAGLVRGWGGGRRAYHRCYYMWSGGIGSRAGLMGSRVYARWISFAHVEAMRRGARRGLVEGAYVPGLRTRELVGQAGVRIGGRGVLQEVFARASANGQGGGRVGLVKRQGGFRLRPGLDVERSTGSDEGDTGGGRGSGSGSCRWCVWQVGEGVCESGGVGMGEAG